MQLESVWHLMRNIPSGDLGRHKSKEQLVAGGCLFGAAAGELLGLESNMISCVFQNTDDEVSLTSLSRSSSADLPAFILAWFFDLFLMKLITCKSQEKCTLLEVPSRATPWLIRKFEASIYRNKPPKTINKQTPKSVLPTGRMSLIIGLVP